MTGSPSSLWPDTEEPAATAPTIEGFLLREEQRAFRIVRYGVGNDDDALDIVQDAMLKLVTHYSGRPADEWPPLFHRILQNGIRDHHRRQTTRRRWFLEPFRRDADDGDAAEDYEDTVSLDLEAQLVLDRDFSALDAAIRELPRRQQQVFLLRCWEGLSTRETAQAMNCSEGSVKTHYFRALNALRKALTEGTDD